MNNWYLSKNNKNSDLDRQQSIECCALLFFTLANQCHANTNKHTFDIHVYMKSRPRLERKK